jgi:hypothetical protein
MTYFAEVHLSYVISAHLLPQPSVGSVILSHTFYTEFIIAPPPPPPIVVGCCKPNGREKFTLCFDLWAAASSQ